MKIVIRLNLPPDFLMALVIGLAALAWFAR